MSTSLRRLFFWGWCVGWAVVAYLCLTPNVVQIAASDKVEHLTGYALVTLSAVTFARDQPQFVRSALAALLLSTLFEFGQLLVPSRLFELADLAANVTGVAIGWTAGAAMLRLRDRLLKPAAASSS